MPSTPARDSDLLARIHQHLGKTTAQTYPSESVVTSTGQVYDICRKALLEVHFWSFAFDRGRLEQGTRKLPGYARTYVLPADFAGVVAVSNGENAQYGILPGLGWRRFRGGVIGANFDPVWLSWTADETDEREFSALFKEALSLYIAETICLGETGDKDLLDRLMARRKGVEYEANQIDYKNFDPSMSGAVLEDFASTRVSGSPHLDYSGVPAVGVTEIPIPEMNPGV